jgi:hypothetical protein
MVRLIRATIFAAAIALLGTAIPTPGPGTGVPLSQPTPINPVQYVVTPGSTGSSAAQNSNFYKVYSDFLGVINALNGCSYIPGAAIGAITAVSPLNVAIGTCSSGTGTGATALLSLGGIVPQANLPAAPVFAGAIESSSNSVTTSYVPPIYFSNGTTTSSLAHSVMGSCVTSATAGCGITLSGAAVFSSPVTWSCSATTVYLGSIGAYAAISTTGGGTNTFSVIYNDGANRNGTINWVCTGY